MPEKLNLQPDPTELYPAASEHVKIVNAAELQTFNPELSLNAFSDFVEAELTPGGIVDSAEQSETIKQAATELIGKYDLKDSLFDDKGRSLMFAAIASRWANKGEDPHEDIFVEDALTLLAHGHSLKLKEVYDYARDDRDKQSDELYQSVYDRFTDRPMSTELKTAMKNGLLKDVKDRLLVTDDTEDDFDVRVLSISTAMSTFGLEGPSTSDIEVPETPGYNPEYSQKINEVMAERSTAANWKDSLEKRAEEFYNALGYHKQEASKMPPAWITTIHGKKQLCIPLPIAKKVLRPEITNDSKYYTDDSAARDRATIEHEFTHTQGGVNLDNGLDFGISLEELRAEDYSGNKQGYHDIKGFSKDLGIITGKLLTNYFSGKLKGGEPFTVWGEIAKDFGLDQMLEIAMVRPNAYDNNQSNLVNKMVAEHLGGFDGVSKRIHDRMIAAGKKEAIESRLESTARTILAIDSEDDFPAFFVNYRRSQGLRFITDMLEEKIKSLQESTIDTEIKNPDGV